MAEATVKQSEAVAWLQDQGPGTAFNPYAVGEDGMSLTGKSIPIIGLGPVYARDRNGKPLVININETAPGDLPTLTITIFEKASLTVLDNLYERKCPINLQLRFVECGVLDNPFLWDKINHWSRGQMTTYNPGDGPSLEYDGTLMQASASVMFREVLTIVRNTLSALTTTEAEDLLSITGLPDEDCNECGTGYPGADQIMFIGAAGGTATGNVIVSGDGGGTWTELTTDPFSTAGEGSDFIACRIMNDNTVRVIAATGTTAAGSAPQYSYVDVTFGDLTTAAWTAKTLTQGANGDVVTAMLWPRHDRLYFGTDANAIFIDEQQGEDGTAVAAYSGASQINAFGASPDGKYVWAVGASNLILRESNQSGVFEARVGPSGGGAFSAVAVADDDTLFAGNGQILYRTYDNALEAGNWESLKDFGAGFTVTKIGLIRGDSQIIRAIVSSVTAGEVWESIDGGNSWRQIPDVANDGYNDAYFSEQKANEAVIVGPVDGSVGQIFQLSPQ
jgi:photosystem II stability/assembly factor-like uncharacterized protein